jgi:hypothetical protein
MRISMPRSSSPKPDALAEGRTSINKIDSQQSIFDGLRMRTKGVLHKPR